MSEAYFNYPEAVKKRIRELEREIDDLKRENRRSRAIPVERGENIAKQCSSGVYSQRLNSHVRWLSMAVIPDIYRQRSRKLQMRSESELTDAEIDVVRNCASEIYSVVEKYVKEARNNAQ